MSRMCVRIGALALLALVVVLGPIVADKEAEPVANRPKVPGTLRLQLRERREDGGKVQAVERTVEWHVAETAIIVCDMWDDHYIQSAAQRVGVMVPRMNQVLTAARDRGVMIIHAPSETMDMYAETPYRQRMQRARAAVPPVPIARRCDRDPGSEPPPPVGPKLVNDDPLPRPLVRKHSRQHRGLDIIGFDGISDSGEEVYNFCAQEGIKNVVLMGVHTNFCILARPFGIRQLKRLGLNVVLARDLTDALYDPRQPPHVSHARGTELVVEHIERYLCPSILSADLTQVVAGSDGPVAAVQTKQPQVVHLWPGKPPGPAHEGLPPEKLFEAPWRKTNPDGPYRVAGRPCMLITNVSQPTITIYRPAREKDTGAALLICPGGGYHNLFWDLHGTEVAEWLNTLGVTGIVLKYRCPRRPGEDKTEPSPAAMQDAQRAVSLVRSKAKEWGIDPKRIGMVGFSAGGHLAGATATGFEKRTYDAVDEIDQVSCRPDFAVMLYSGYLKHRDKDELASGLRIPAGTPPIMLAHASDDPISHVDNSVVMYTALQRAGVPVEMHLYATGGHPFGVRPSEQPCTKWPEACAAWLKHRGFLMPGGAKP